MNHGTIYTLENIRDYLVINPVVKQRIIIGESKSAQYRLVKGLWIKLSNGRRIYIPAGFEWDLSSAPRALWPIFPPDGDFELAALIHDYLYRTKTGTRGEADYEMLLWSTVVNNSLIDNVSRYIAVRLFGWVVWKKKK